MGSKNPHFLNLENSFSILLLFPKSEKNYNDTDVKNTKKNSYSATPIDFESWNRNILIGYFNFPNIKFLKLILFIKPLLDWLVNGSDNSDATL